MLIIVQQTLKFINDDASSKHGSLKVGSIYTSESGEWRLGGFEVLSNMKESETTLDVSFWMVQVKKLRLANTLPRATEAWFLILADMRRLKSLKEDGERPSRIPFTPWTLSTLEP
jgi:hypothetical protein